MAPTTLPGMHTTTSPDGRDVLLWRSYQGIGTDGKPARCILCNTTGCQQRQWRKKKESLAECIQIPATSQRNLPGRDHRQLSLQLEMTPVEASKFIDEEMIKAFPLGDIKVPAAGDLKTLQSNTHEQS